MNYERSNFYSHEFLKENMMGPNSVRILNELCEKINLKPGMRILDLGCGKALTSIFLAKTFDVTVFATDLWIEPTENFLRIKQFGMDERVFPIHADVHELTYANEFFDAVISVDAYHYFGYNEEFLDKHIVPMVKKGGIVAIAVPGMKDDFSGEFPEVLKPFCPPDANFFSVNQWKTLWSKSTAVTVDWAGALESHQKAWEEWLEADNPYAKNDIHMIEAEAGNYFNIVGITATVK